MENKIRLEEHSEFCKCDSCPNPVSKNLEINGVEYLVTKRYVCSSKEHGAIESDFVDMRNATPCKYVLKWTKELPSKEGWYWLINFKTAEYSRFYTEMILVHVSASDRHGSKGYLNENEVYIIEKWCDRTVTSKFFIVGLKDMSGEWYGPIEPPKYP